MSAAKKYFTKFVKKIQLNPNTFEFYFEKPPGFKFSPGQYLKMFLPIENPDMRGTSRYFTISSSPLVPYLTITTRAVRSSFKKTLKNLKDGETVSIFGPLGYFNLNQENQKPKVFLAAGMGVTPYHSILRTIYKDKISFDIFLFASFEKSSDAIYLKDFKQMETINPKLKVIFTLSKEKKVEFEKGRISIDMIEKYFPKWKNAEFFVVGSESAEKGLLDLLKRVGIEEENIFSENFPGY